jgi:hypothetical protein
VQRIKARKTLEELEAQIASYRLRSNQRATSLLEGVSRLRQRLAAQASSGMLKEELPCQPVSRREEADRPANVTAPQQVRLEINTVELARIIETLEHSVNVMKERSQPRTALPDRLRESRTGRLLLMIPFMKRAVLNLYFLASHEARSIAAENARQTSALVTLIKLLR